MKANAKWLYLIGGVLSLSACANQTFLQKKQQTTKQFETDRYYCHSEALGIWQDVNGVSSIGVRRQKIGNQSYEDCMRQLGYQPAP